MITPKRAAIFILLLSIFCLYVTLPHEIRINLPFLKLDRKLTKPQLAIGRFTLPTDLKQGLDIQGGSRLVYEAQFADTRESDKSTALTSARDVIERRVNLFGVSEAIVQTLISQGTYRIVAELPGLTDTNQAIDQIGKTALLEFRELKTSTSAPEIVTLDSTIPTGVTGRDMRLFQISYDTTDGSPAVSFETSEEGRAKFAALTRRLIGKPLLTFLDGQLISQAIVQSEIDGQGQITGKFTLKEAKNMVSLFNAGSLPVPLRLIEQQTIGASLGQESVARSIRGGLVGLAVVMAFMCLYYGRLGLIADIALIVYGLVTLTIYKLLPVTLTLPGIAGFLLSVGMAVDSNILIFERFKDETRSGQRPVPGMERAFGKAWESIKDANIATLIATFILYNPLNWSFLNTSGMVRGFAFTLFLGIAISLFTGIVVTRTLIRVMYLPQSDQAK